ncbi:MAG: hypothetical protein IPM79_03435 [Polyangiaceae bacterium]|jgi:hypothetical protein|nr:hypothetical protein [Polyangiaceae bacterium]MBK8936715.1 hypothetical protein [Polyangiaceae bacterium]
MNRLIASTALSLLAALSFACGAPSMADLCDRYGDECNVSSAEVQECQAAAAFVEASVEGSGCEDELDEWLSCIDGVEDVCNEDLVEASCQAESDAMGNCISVDDVQDDDPPAG